MIKHAADFSKYKEISQVDSEKSASKHNASAQDRRDAKELVSKMSQHPIANKQNTRKVQNAKD